MTDKQQKIMALQAQLIPILKNIDIGYAQLKALLPQDIYDETVRITAFILPPPQAIDGSYEEWENTPDYRVYTSAKYREDLGKLTKKLEAISGATAILGVLANNIAPKKSILWQIRYLQEGYLEAEYRRIKKLYNTKKQEIADTLSETGKRLNQEIADLQVAIKTDYDTRKAAAKVEMDAYDKEVSDRLAKRKHDQELEIVRVKARGEERKSNAIREALIAEGISPMDINEVLRWQGRNLALIAQWQEQYIDSQVRMYSHAILPTNDEIFKKQALFKKWNEIANDPARVNILTTKQAELNNLTVDKTLVAQQDAFKAQVNSIARAFNRANPTVSNNLYVSDTGKGGSFTKLITGVTKPYVFENTSKTDKYYAVTGVNVYGESGLSNVVKVDGIKSNVLAGGQIGIFGSSDNGNTWAVTGQTTKPWYSFAVLSNGDILAGGGGDFGIYKSTDNGNTWVVTSKTTGAWHSFAVLSDGSILAGSGSSIGIWKSVDGGNTWTVTGQATGYWRSLAVLLNGDILAGSFSPGIWKSVDGGNTWTVTGQTTKSWYSFAVLSDGSILAGSGGNFGIYKSTDGGNTWMVTSKDNGDWHSFAVLSDGSILAGSGINDGIVNSYDDGNTWMVTSKDTGNWRCFAVLSNGDILTGGDNSGIWKSVDNGNTWAVTDKGNGTWLSFAVLDLPPAPPK